MVAESGAQTRPAKPAPRHTKESTKMPARPPPRPRRVKVYVQQARKEMLGRRKAKSAGTEWKAVNAGKGSVSGRSSNGWKVNVGGSARCLPRP
jgi:hypothetical protein